MCQPLDTCLFNILPDLLGTDAFLQGDGSQALALRPLDRNPLDPPGPQFHQLGHLQVPPVDVEGDGFLLLLLDGESAADLEGDLVEEGTQLGGDPQPVDAVDDAVVLVDNHGDLDAVGGHILPQPAKLRCGEGADQVGEEHGEGATPDGDGLFFLLAVRFRHGVSLLLGLLRRLVAPG